MATPKKKVSKSRRNMRRFAGGNRLDKPTIVTCPNCSEPTLGVATAASGFTHEYRSADTVSRLLQQFAGTLIGNFRGLCHDAACSIHQLRVLWLHVYHEVAVNVA